MTTNQSALLVIRILSDKVHNSLGADVYDTNARLHQLPLS